MSPHTGMLSDAICVLKGLTREKPWMTARGLALRINRERDRHYGEADLRNALIGHSKCDNRVIRYAFYPSKRTLDILWGHVEVVGEHRSLPPLERRDAPAGELREESITAEQGGAVEEDDASSESGPSDGQVFLSHNHRDVAAVFELREKIQAGGFECWAFQVGIEEGANITLAVSDALEASKYFISYVSRHALGSLWVSKELEVLHNFPETRPFVFVDGQDCKLLDLFESWPTNQSDQQDHINACAEILGDEIAETKSDLWRRRCRDLLGFFPQLLREEQVIYAFPAAGRTWNGEAFRLEDLASFIERLKRP